MDCYGFASKKDEDVTVFTMAESMEHAKHILFHKVGLDAYAWHHIITVTPQEITPMLVAIAIRGEKRSDPNMN